MKTILKTVFSGYDWHDMCDMSQFLTFYGSENLGDHADDILIKDIYEELKNLGYENTYYEGEKLVTKAEMLPNLPAFDVVRENILNKKAFSCKDMDSPVTADILFKDKGADVKISANMCGYQYSVSYMINDIETPMYMAVEEFLAPFKGAFTIQRTYEEPTRSKKIAKEALTRIPDKREGYNTHKYIAVFDKNTGINKEWLETNLKAAQAMRLGIKFDVRANVMAKATE